MVRVSTVTSKPENKPLSMFHSIHKSRISLQLQNGSSFVQIREPLQINPLQRQNLCYTVPHITCVTRHKTKTRSHRHATQPNIRPGSLPTPPQSTKEPVTLAVIIPARWHFVLTK